MLLSSMDHLNYYSMPKESFLELDTSGADGYSLQGDEMGYLNEENSPKNGTKSSLYKTELCKRFSEFGNCRYGAKCQFAHGLAELRHVVRHPKYKTTKCKSYWGSGHCPYGSRCRFIHEETEGFSQPQFSPPGSMFLHDKDHLSLSPMGPPSVGELGGPGSAWSYSAASSYGDHHQDQQNQHMMQGAGLAGYQQKEYSLLPSFDKSTWGNSTPVRSQPPAAPLTYATEHFKHGVGSGAIGSLSASVPPSTVTPPPPSYPDLQDAIDALMKFSLTSPESESTTGTISSSPVDSAVGGQRAEAVKTDYSRQSEELWKDFPSVTSGSVVGTGASTSVASPVAQWPSGLVLTLDSSKSFDADNQKELSGSSAAKSHDEESPRLSVFERFH